MGIDICCVYVLNAHTEDYTNIYCKKRIEDVLDSGFPRLQKVGWR